MSDYLIADKAAADLVNIEDSYIERGGSEANATHLIAGLFESFQTIADFPDIGTSRPYLPKTVRALPHGKYIICYQISVDTVEIVQVLYGGMDLSA